eukprot:SAG11_NODE_20778_length_438_cov_1.070796_1_plen_22_part_10
MDFSFSKTVHFEGQIWGADLHL